MPSDAELQAYEELHFYSLAHGDPSFLHQHVVDAWAAQHADASTKPIAIAFALAGLYLHLECGFNGRQVQRAHMQLARQKERLPHFDLPVHRGAVTAIQVMHAPDGEARDAAIDEWCAAVWSAYVKQREKLAEWLRREGILDGP